MSRVAAVVLAAGGSTRMGRPKQLLPFRERRRLRHAVEVAVAARCDPVVVVLGAYADRLRDEPSEALIDYAQTKAAIVSFTKSVAKSLAEKGIRVNAVAPGPVWTPLIVTTMPEDKVKSFGEDVPLKRPAQPAELAPTFVFLASAEASYVTGEVFGNVGGKSPF